MEKKNNHRHIYNVDQNKLNISSLFAQILDVYKEINTI